MSKQSWHQRVESRFDKAIADHNRRFPNSLIRIAVGFANVDDAKANDPSTTYGRKYGHVAALIDFQDYSFEVMVSRENFGRTRLSVCEIQVSFKEFGHDSLKLPANPRVLLNLLDLSEYSGVSLCAQRWDKDILVFGSKVRVSMPVTWQSLHAALHNLWMTTPEIINWIATRKKSSWRDIWEIEKNFHLPPEE